MTRLIRSISLAGIFFAIYVAIGYSLFQVGWSDTWRCLAIPPMKPPFSDMRTVQASIHAIAIGLNPQVENPSDPWARPMNYPLVWSDIAKILHLENENIYIFFCSIMVLIYILLSCKIFIEAGTIYVLPIFFSSASLLAIERGNNDLIVFELLYFSSFMSITISTLSILSAVGLKIYPIFAITAFINNKKMLVTLVAGGAIILFFMLPEINTIRSATPVSFYSSYGAPSLAILLSTKLNLNIHPFIINLLLIISAFSLKINKWLPLVITNHAEGQNKFLFLMGSSVYVGTFIFSSNWDYRLIFLIFCIPYIGQFLNNFLKFTLLIMIAIACNDLLLGHVSGAYGHFASISAKGVLFILLFILIIDLYKKLLLRNYSS